MKVLQQSSPSSLTAVGQRRGELRFILRSSGFITALRLATLRFGIDWNRVDYLSRAQSLNVPILLFHGDDDPTVPVATSDALAGLRPDLVTYHRVSGAGHVRSWNSDPAAYEEAVRDFVVKVIQE